MSKYVQQRIPLREHNKRIASTRFNELFFSPLPLNATQSKVRKMIIESRGMRCSSVRVHRGVAAASAFVVFYSDSDAAEALKLLANKLVIENNKVDVKYTVDYSEDNVKPQQQVVTRVRQAFIWMTENQINVRDLPFHLKYISPSSSFTPIDSQSCCSETHIQCGFFKSKTSDQNYDRANNESPVIDVPSPVIYKHNEVSPTLVHQLHNATNKSYQAASKPAKKKPKKRQGLAKINAELNKPMSTMALQPGMGRGFASQHHMSNARQGMLKNNKPCAVICPMKKEVTALPNQDSPTKPMGRGRGISSLAAGAFQAMNKY